MADHHLTPMASISDAGATYVQLVERTTSALIRYRELRVDQDWIGLVAHSAILAGQADTILSEIAERSLLADEVRADHAASERFARAAFSAIAEAPGPEGEAARADLLERLTIREGDPVAAQAAMERLFSGDGPMFEQAQRFVSAFDNEEEELVRNAVRLRSFADLARHTGLMKLSARITFEFVTDMVDGENLHSDVSATEPDVTLAQSLANEIQAETEAGFAVLFAALDDGRTVDEFADLAAALRVRLGPRISIGGRVLGGFLPVAHLTLEAAAQTEQFRSALKLTEWCRRMHLLAAYCTYVVGSARCRDANRWYGIERRRLENRQFASGVPSGSPTNLAELVSADPAMVDELVEVEGHVRSISVEDDPSPPKFSTFIMLEDRLTGDQLKLRAHQFSLIVNGVADGAFCRLSGFVRQETPWLEQGQTGLDIDRVALTELRRTSWMDDLTHRMRNFYTLRPDEMNMFHTPEFLSQEG